MHGPPIRGIHGVAGGQSAYSDTEGRAGRGGGRRGSDTQVRRADGIADGEVGNRSAPVGRGLGVGELVGGPESAVGGLDVDADEVAGPATAAEIVVVRLTGPSRHPDRGFHGSSRIA